MTGVSSPSIGRDRAAILIGATAIALAVFVFSAAFPTEFRFVNIGPVGAGILVVGGVGSIVGGIMRRRLPQLIAGALLTGAALVQLVGLAFSIRPLGGDASAMAAVGGLGIGLLVLSLSPTHSDQPTDPTKGRP